MYRPFRPINILIAYLCLILRSHGEVKTRPTSFTPSEAMLLAGGLFATESPNILAGIESPPLLKPLFALKSVTLAQATRFPSHQVDGPLRLHRAPVIASTSPFPQRLSRTSTPLSGLVVAWQGGQAVVMRASGWHSPAPLRTVSSTMQVKMMKDVNDSHSRARCHSPLLLSYNPSHLHLQLLFLLILHSRLALHSCPIPSRFLSHTFKISITTSRNVLSS